MRIWPSSQIFKILYIGKCQYIKEIFLNTVFSDISYSVKTNDVFLNEDTPNHLEYTN